MQDTADARSRAQAALTASPVYSLRDLRVEEHGQQLMISGRVDSFYLKQLAQEVVRTVADGRHVVNSINVE